MTVKEVLKRVLDEWTEDKYCREHWSLDANGEAILPREPKACKWCISGYVAYAIGFRPNEQQLKREVMEAIDTVSITHHDHTAIDLNDYLGYQITYDVVKKALATMNQ
ncbi:MAG: hypothetical protein ACRCZI_13630 [Cetobacterium sp.]